MEQSVFMEYAAHPILNKYGSFFIVSKKVPKHFLVFSRAVGNCHFIIAEAIFHCFGIVSYLETAAGGNYKCALVDFIVLFNLARNMIVWTYFGEAIKERGLID